MAKSENDAIPLTPLYETRSMSPLHGGLIKGTDGSMWMYRVAPQSNIVDAKIMSARIAAGATVHGVFEELAASVGRGLNRRMVKGQCREIHVHATNIPTWFRDQPGTGATEYNNRQFRNKTVIKRMVLFGIKLKAKTGSGGFESFWDSFTETLYSGTSPLSDYDEDFKEFSAMFDRHGFTIPTPQDFALANGWWNHGKSAGIPIMPHPEHLHFFQKTSAIRDAEKFGIDRLSDEYYERHNEMPRDSKTLTTLLDRFKREALSSCDGWPDIEDETSITFAAVQDTEFGYLDTEESAALWASHLYGSGARVISIRGSVEPAKITRQELKRGKRALAGDIKEAETANKSRRAEIEEKAAELEQLEDIYASGNASATLINTSIIIGFGGSVEDVSKNAPQGIILSAMTNRQAAALHETMICSPYRANPHTHDFPVTVVAYAGIQSLTQVGDDTGALIGFTEVDSQPVYLSPTAASAGDGAPLLLCGSATGGGKTMLLLKMSQQFSMLGSPVVIIDPKPDSDHQPFVEASGGLVASLDDLVQSDGVLDPLRFSKSAQAGINMAAVMISNVNPWGDDNLRRQYETDILFAIGYGVRERGARATGEALKYAVDDGKIGAEIVAPIFRLAEMQPMFRATFGVDPQTPPLSVAEGITLFKVGSAQFSLPSASDMRNMREAVQGVRVSVNVINMLVMGAMSAFEGRGGVIQIDESWVLEKAAPDALEQIGRLARSQNVLVCLYTQTPAKTLELGLKGYFSRGLIGHIKDEKEASAGLELFEANSPNIRGRVMAPEFLGDGTGTAVNYRSLKALRHPDRSVVRGSVFYMCDLRGRIAPVEIVLDEDFLRLASTTPADVAARRAAKALAAN